MRRPIGGAIAPANAALMVEQTVVSVGPRRRFVPTTELANQIADALEDGLALPAPAPTNNPDGISSAIFAAIGTGDSFPRVATLLSGATSA
jgi:hypothetical protein